MKNLLLLLAIATLSETCKKDEKITEQPVTTTVPENVKNDLQESETDEYRLPEYSADLKVLPIKETSDLGKAVFSQNDNPVFSFSKVNQKGQININGTEYALTKLEFTDNLYQITGPDIEILAEDGAFEEMTSDCMYGKFAEVFVTLKGKQTILRDVKVQDCPNY